MQIFKKYGLAFAKILKIYSKGNMKKIENILNYRTNSESLSTAGQPLIDEFKLIADEGFEAIVNIRPDFEMYGLFDEKQIVENLGMKYYKVPMTFDSLNSNVLSDFFDRLEKLSERKILVHCHHNIRVSVLLAFYRIIKLKWEKDKAFEELGKMVDLNSMWDDYFTFHINNYLASQSS
jgi:protein tyrosine phosphatase (PTP) superfamily phosphohydrolase (DUF442 family)